MPGGLGRRVPLDWVHVDRYPLSAVPRRAAVGKPVVFGVDWYSNFDRPVHETGGQFGRWWIGRGDLGSVRGGHAICGLPHGVKEPNTWWEFYDQGSEGACVGFSCSRMLSLLNRHRFDAPWLYHEAQLTDGFADTPPAEGTSVRAGLDILRSRGHRRVVRGVSQEVDVEERIREFRWARSWDEVRAVLRIPDSVGGVPLLNSWGRSYPRVVYLADEAGERLLREDGEAAVVTDL